MLFIATLSHDPADCWARGEHRQKALTWIAEMDERAAEHDVAVHGAYVTPNEHTFYIVVEADAFDDVTAFLGPPFLEDHDGRIAPILSLEREGLQLLEEE